MNTEHIQNKFDRLGARVRFRSLEATRNRSAMPGWLRNAGSSQNNAVPLPPNVRIDIATDRRGEYFDIAIGEDADLLVLDTQPRDRHLLLLNRQVSNQPRQPEIKHKFLCGHDERHWFVAGIPENTPVSSVVTAKESLKPGVVRNLEGGLRGKQADRHRRKTEIFVRQGEWFFVPAPYVVADPKTVQYDEPLRRGRGKPHHCEFLFRTGGETVYVCGQYPNGLTEKQRSGLIARNPSAASFNWRVMQRNPTVFVRGRVSHADHATIRLDGWHQVWMNTEAQSSAMASVAFLD